MNPLSVSPWIVRAKRPHPLRAFSIGTAAFLCLEGLLYTALAASHAPLELLMLRGMLPAVVGAAAFVWYSRRGFRPI